MNIKIGRKKYELNPAAITLIRYRAQYGESFIQKFLQSAEFDEILPAWIRLLYVAIKGDKPDYDEYVKAVKADMGTFLLSALAFQNELMRCSGKSGGGKSTGGGTEDFDELKIAALTVGLPEYLVMELNIYDLLEVIINANTTKSQQPTKKYVKMTSDQLISLYGGKKNG